MRSTIDARIQRGLGATFEKGFSRTIEMAQEQLTRYFEGTLTEFSVPIRFIGTPFQCAVWEALLHIPYGHTSTYTELTARVSRPEAIRAVASANGANALSILVPCHRVIGSTGELVGYAGGLRAKRHLLQLEAEKARTTFDLFSNQHST